MLFDWKYLVGKYESYFRENMDLNHHGNLSVIRKKKGFIKVADPNFCSFEGLKLKGNGENVSRLFCISGF